MWMEALHPLTFTAIHEIPFWVQGNTLALLVHGPCGPEGCLVPGITVASHIVVKHPNTFKHKCNCNAVSDCNATSYVNTGLINQPCSRIFVLPQTPVFTQWWHCMPRRHFWSISILVHSVSVLEQFRKVLRCDFICGMHPRGASHIYVQLQL